MLRGRPERALITSPGATPPESRDPPSTATLKGSQQLSHSDVTLAGSLVTKCEPGPAPGKGWDPFRVRSTPSAGLPRGRLPPATLPAPFQGAGTAKAVP